jgi:hypothetical protein
MTRIEERLGKQIRIRGMEEPEKEDRGHGQQQPWNRAQPTIR